MKYITKLKLATAHQWCDVEDKSTEYTIQFLMDTVGVDLECVTNYFNLSDEEIKRLFNEALDYSLFFAKTFEGYEEDNN